MADCDYMIPKLTSLSYYKSDSYHSLTFGFSFAEVEELRAEMDGIKVKGKNCPRPIQTWAQAGVAKKVLDTLKK